MNTCENTDKEIWRLKPGDFYSPSIHVTNQNGIGINCGGHVMLLWLRLRHGMKQESFCFV